MNKSITKEIMEAVQVFASAWSLVGGQFDDGTMLWQAEEQKAAIRALLSAALPTPTIPTDTRSTFSGAADYDQTTPFNDISGASA